MFQYKTKGNVSPQGKRRVYFTCHPKDYERFFERISAEVLNITECAVWYSKDEGYEDIDTDLGQMNLLVVSVTTRLLTKPCRTMELDVPFALEHHIPILPLMQEGGLDELFSRNFGDLQYLDPNARDETAISYEEKLKKYLNSVLVGDELAEKVRAAFDAYIFLSYRKKDRKYANELMRLIHKNDFCRDIAIWYDEYLTPGENFNDAISYALKKSDLFTMVVTPNLVNEKNYVESVEYPEAMKQKKPILPVELEKTNHDALSKHYRGIPNSVDARDETVLLEVLESTLSRIAHKENDIDPQHNFFIGLAYLDGIDVEVNHERALSLITFAAESKEGKVPEAMEKLVSMYSEGHGVERNYRIAVEWQKKLVEHWEVEYHNSHSIEDYRKLFSALLSLREQFCNLRDLDAAECANRRMIALSGQIVEKMGTIESRQDLAGSYHALGLLRKERGDLDGVEDFYRKSLALRAQLAEETRTNESRLDLALICNSLGTLHKMRGDLDGAEELYRSSCTLVRLLEVTGAVESRRYLAGIYENLGDLRKAKGDLNEAEELYRSSLALRERLAEETGTVDSKRDLAFIYNSLGILRKMCGDLDKAEELYKRSLALREQLAEETGTVDSRQGLALIYNNLGNLCQIRNNLDMAEDFYRKSLALKKRLAEETRTIEAYYSLAISYFNTAVIQKPYHWSLLEEALQITTELATQCPQVTQYSELRNVIKNIFEQERNKISGIL